MNTVLDVQSFCPKICEKSLCKNGFSPLKEILSRISQDFSGTTRVLTAIDSVRGCPKTMKCLPGKPIKG